MWKNCFSPLRGVDIFHLFELLWMVYNVMRLSDISTRVSFHRTDGQTGTAGLSSDIVKTCVKGCRYQSL